MALLDVYRLTRTVILDGVRHVNVMHFQDTVGTFPAGTEETELMDHFDQPPAVDDQVERKIHILQHGYDTITKVGLTVQRIQPTLGFEVGRAFNNVVPALPAAAGLPQFAQAKLTFFSDLPGRSGRGGIYLSGLQESQVVASTPDANMTNQLDDIIQAFIDSFTAPGPQFIGFALGVFSRLLIEFHPVISIARASTVGTMRSRRVGVGA